MDDPKRDTCAHEYNRTPPTKPLAMNQGSPLAVLARVENDLWHGADDPGVASRVARALALGCDGVKVNVYSKNEARGRSMPARAGTIVRISRASLPLRVRRPNASVSSMRTERQER